MRRTEPFRLDKWHYTPKAEHQQVDTGKLRTIAPTWIATTHYQAGQVHRGQIGNHRQ
jgi:hypothetical protein